MWNPRELARMLSPRDDKKYLDNEVLIKHSIPKDSILETYRWQEKAGLKGLHGLQETAKKHSLAVNVGIHVPAPPSPNSSGGGLDVLIAGMIITNPKEGLELLEMMLKILSEMRNANSKNTNHPLNRTIQTWGGPLNE
ncbi:hypothetical protein K4K48_010316 [Colletotrichum sp. SAR 10_66]|nr:hypothetical protein K4K48_010316 [Colletotrichum sp. SAR 10_66]